MLPPRPSTNLGKSLFIVSIMKERVSCDIVLIVPRISTLSQTTFSASPPLNDPTVITASSLGSILLLTIDCRNSTTFAPISIASTPLCGSAACEEIPFTVSLNIAEVAWALPYLTPIFPSSISGAI